MGLSPERLAQQIEASGDEELLFALAHALLELKAFSPELDKLRSALPRRRVLDVPSYVAPKIWGLAV